MRAISRQILEEAVLSGDVYLTVLEAQDEHLIEDSVDTPCDAQLKPTVDQVRTAYRGGSLNFMFQAYFVRNLTVYHKGPLFETSNSVVSGFDV